MQAFGFVGHSGSGKTTLIERLLPRFMRARPRVSVIKEVRRDFDIDRPGKDSHRHREAGAFEVMIASDRR
jgi:molybdopterin-guanine dinucleotide biosynthesis protein B